MSKILIIEDEPDMLRGLQDNLEFEGYEVDIADNGQTGLKMISAGGYDLILLDIMLPDISGFNICERTRDQGIKTPIILLTARGEEMDKVRGLELGADDYITKPFSLPELLARLKAILRRTDAGDDIERSQTCTIGNLTVNFQTYEATIDSHSVKMSTKEFDILWLLMKRKHEVVHRDEILSEVWNIDSYITPRTVDNFVHKLRQKIEDDPANPQNIVTIHGIGYKLIR
ncbi:MAG: response regulator transcription factor [Bacteroidales bacterium]